MVARTTRVGQRFAIGERVCKRYRLGDTRTVPPRRGVVKEVVEEEKKMKNRAPFKAYSYRILWDGSRSLSLHAQQALRSLEND